MTPQKQNQWRREAKLFDIRIPFRQMLYVVARNMGYPPLKAWSASGHCINWRFAKIDPAVVRKMKR